MNHHQNCSCRHCLEHQANIGAGFLGIASVILYLIWQIPDYLQDNDLIVEFFAFIAIIIGSFIYAGIILPLIKSKLALYDLKRNISRLAGFQIDKLIKVSVESSAKCNQDVQGKERKLRLLRETIPSIQKSLKTIDNPVSTLRIWKIVSVFALFKSTLLILYFYCDLSFIISNDFLCYLALIDVTILTYTVKPKWIRRVGAKRLKSKLKSNKALLDDLEIAIEIAKGKYNHAQRVEEYLDLVKGISNASSRFEQETSKSKRTREEIAIHSRAILIIREVLLENKPPEGFSLDPFRNVLNDMNMLADFHSSTSNRKTARWIRDCGWRCNECTSFNLNYRTTCIDCESEYQRVNPKGNFDTCNGWFCEHCEYYNLTRRIKCAYCNEDNHLLKPGLICVGMIRNIKKYGVFINIGGVDGLLHVSNMAWKRVKHPKEILDGRGKGDLLKVKILKVDFEKEQISLGLKQLVDKVE